MKSKTTSETPLRLGVPPKSARKCPLCEMGVPIKKICGPYRIEDEETGEELGIYLSEETVKRMQEQLKPLDLIGKKIKLILKKGEIDVLQQDR